MPKFLIIRFSSIGDIIQCMGIIDGIREHFPDAEIHWIARKVCSSFLAMDKRTVKYGLSIKHSALRPVKNRPATPGGALRLYL